MVSALSTILLLLNVAVLLILVGYVVPAARQQHRDALELLEQARALREAIDRDARARGPQ